MPEQPEAAENCDLCITQVKRHTKRRDCYHIYLNDVFAFTVHEDVLLKHRLFIGKQLNRQQIDLILNEDDREKALAQAMRYIGLRPRSTREVLLYLQRKEYRNELCEEVIAKLKTQGYIDDERFAVWWVEQRLFNQHKGKKWVCAELEQKGLAKDLITAALNQIEEGAELKSATTIALKKWKQLKGTELEKRRRLAAYLVRNGFAISLVKPVLQAIQKDEQPDD